MPVTTIWLQPWQNPDNYSIEIQIDPSTIRGQRGIFGAELLLHFTATSRTRDSKLDITLHSLEGSITWNTEMPFKPGLQIPPQTVDPNTHLLHVPITDAHIYAIEERRAGDFVPLRIALRGLATIPNKRVPVAGYVVQPGYVLQQGDTTVQPIPRLETQIVQEQTNNGEVVFIQLQDWLRILNELEFAKHRLLELPEPNLPLADDANWKTCLQLLEEATRLFRTGVVYDPVLGNCRRIIEGVVEVVCNRFGIQRNPKSSFNAWSQGLVAQLTSVWPDDPAAPRLFHSLCLTAYSWASGSHHYNAKIPQRSEAAFALAMTTDLLVFGTQILQATITPAQADSASSATTAENSTP